MALIRGALTVGGLALIVVSALMIAIPLGVLVAGCALLVLESLMGG